MNKASVNGATVRAGRLIKIENKNRPKFSNAAKEYFAMWVEDANGKNERCWFLTSKDIERLEHRSGKNKEDWTKKGWLKDLLD